MGLDSSKLLAAALGLVIAVLGWIEYSLLIHSRVSLSRESFISLAFSVLISIAAWGRFVFLKGNR